MLKLQKPWDSQPQEAVGVDWGHAASLGLVFAWNGAASNFDATTSTRATTAPASAITSISKYGIGWQQPTNTPLVFPDAGKYDVTGEFTVFALVKNNTLAAEASVVAKTTTNGATATPFDFGNTGSTGKLRLGRANSAYRVWASGTATLSSNSAYAIAATQGADISVGPEFWTDGVKDAAAPASLYIGTGSGAATANSLGLKIGNRDDNATDYDGGIYLIYVWNRVLLDAEISALSANPWQLFAPRSIWVPVSVGGSVTGTSATTNANDTSAASGTTTVVGTSATTNANDTATASGSVGGAVTGTSATTNANDTSSASGTTTVTGTVAYSNANDSAAASGWAGSVSGTAAVTNANDTAQASGTVEGGATDTHDGFWSREWAKLKKREEEPTIAEVVEIVKESPQVMEVVRVEVERKYPQVDYAEVRQNLALQRFIAKQLIEAAEEEDDIEAMLLMA